MKLITVKGLMISAGLTMGQFAAADFLPPNQLHLQDGRFKAGNTGIDEATFNRVIDRLEEVYTPIVAQHGATLDVLRNWQDSTVNAYARRKGTVWTVAMFGGLARRPEVTADGFAIVVCHELGHQLGGFPFTSSWAANEGEADYFASQSCARDLWASEVILNATHATSVNTAAKAKCDEVWNTESQKNLCYRISNAVKSSVNLLATLNSESAFFEKEDSQEVTHTDHSHPASQCRLDTYFAGALCNVDFESSLIPGFSFGAQRNGTEAEEEAAAVSCHQKTASIGVRPRCWFKPRI